MIGRRNQNGARSTPPPVFFRWTGCFAQIPFNDQLNCSFALTSSLNKWDLDSTSNAPNSNTLSRIMLYFAVITVFSRRVFRERSLFWLLRQHSVSVAENSKNLQQYVEITTRIYV